ncbi:hypothetical protein KR215_000587, partial [Drosophila sulfurigaster]
RMVRQNRRKGIEEVYGSKLEAMQPGRPQNLPQPGMTKTATMRVASSRQGDSRTQRSYVTANDYYITTNVPLNSTNMRTANTSNIVVQPSKTSHMPVQMQAASTQAMPYGSISNRRNKASARQPIIQNPPQKVHFVPTDANKVHGHMHSHGHNHSHAQGGMPMQITQRTVYAQNMDMEPSIVELSDKDIIMNTSNLNVRRQHTHLHQNQQPHPHPLQHQLHQQQQLNNQINPTNNNNNMHHKHQHQQQQQRQQHHHQQPHQQPHQRQGHSQQHRGSQLQVEADVEEKDDDPEEFFELIRQTVKTAVGTTICDVVSRNFRDLSSKMERFSNELKTTNDHLAKLQTEVTNKVMHYGEENTRHFRYLCMKSEYDKMFYQHQTMITGKQSSNKVAAASQANLATAAVPTAITTTRVAKQSAAINQKTVKQQLAAAKLETVSGNLKSLKTRDCVKAQNPCACRSTSRPTPSQPQIEERPSSSDQSISVKSSALGVREVLGQIQRFCTQMQLTDLKDEQPKYNSMTGISAIELSAKPGCVPGNLSATPIGNDPKVTKSPDGGDAIDVETETPVDSMDEIEIDNFQYSSDEMSSYSDDSDVKFSGSTTARAPLQSAGRKMTSTHINKGAGDGQ